MGKLLSIGDAVMISIQDLELLQKLGCQFSIQITGQCFYPFLSSGPGVDN